jgi:hypothetical protein
MNVVLCTHEPLSPAVQRCCDARNRMIERDRNMPPEDLPQIPKDLTDIRAQGKYMIDSLIFLDALDPNLAYRTAMPEPVNRRAIKAYIACVLHGMAIQAIEQQEGRNLLYGARTAALLMSQRNNKPKQTESQSAAPSAQPTEYDLYLAECQKRREEAALRPK